MLESNGDDAAGDGAAGSLFSRHAGAETAGQSEGSILVKTEIVAERVEDCLRTVVTGEKFFHGNFASGFIITGFLRRNAPKCAGDAGSQARIVRLHFNSARQAAAMVSDGRRAGKKGGTTMVTERLSVGIPPLGLSNWPHNSSNSAHIPLTFSLILLKFHARHGLPVLKA